jgi:hypothetical protein
MKNDGWWSRDNDKAEAEYFSWCQEGHTSETDHSDPAEYDREFCRQMSFRLGTGGGFCEHGSKPSHPRSWAISLLAERNRIIRLKVVSYVRIDGANGRSDLNGRSAWLRTRLKISKMLIIVIALLLLILLFHRLKSCTRRFCTKSFTLLAVMRVLRKNVHLCFAICKKPSS